MRYHAIGHFYLKFLRENYVSFWLFLLFHFWMFLDSQIREKLIQLQEKRDKINKKWQDKMDYLQIGMGTQHIIQP